jgi:hypothetical protein
LNKEMRRLEIEINPKPLLEDMKFGCVKTYWNP